MEIAGKNLLDIAIMGLDAARWIILIWMIYMVLKLLVYPVVFSSRVREKRMKQWSMTQGRITGIHIRTFPINVDGKQQMFSTPTVEYQYNVLGKQYTQKEELSDYTSAGEHAERLPQSITIGSTVTVRYHPRKHSKAILQK